MQSGAQIIMSRDALHVGRHLLESIGLYPSTEVHILPIRSHEAREREPGWRYPRDLLISPIAPSAWPFAMRLVVRVCNRPRSVDRVLRFLAHQGVDVLYLECTRSGHHHLAMNVLGLVRSLVSMKLDDLWKGLVARRGEHSIVASESNCDADPADRQPWWWDVLDNCAESGAAWPAPNQSNGRSRLRNSRIEAGRALAEASSAGPPFGLLALLERLIAEARPAVSALGARLDRLDVTPESVSLQVEQKMLNCKAVLAAVTAYKHMLAQDLKNALILDALESSEKGGTARWHYIYNLEYYREALSHPELYGCRSFEKRRGSADTKTLRDRLRSAFGDPLGSDRHGDWASHVRLDLDPILVLPVESLCHAYYHRAYEREYLCRVGESQIQLPASPEFKRRVVEPILPRDRASTFALASVNREDLTLRACPIPISHAGRFVHVTLEQYSRRCHDGCGCADPSPMSPPQAPPVKATRTADTVGVLDAFASVVSAWDSEPGQQHEPLSIWRMHNQIRKLSSTEAHGEAHIIAEATGSHFTGFPAGFGEHVRCRLARATSGSNQPHVSIGIATARPISGGRVFVSLPFKHPMSEQWLRCIREIGLRAGFEEVDTARSSTQSVTPQVAERIRQSHGVIQVLSLPLGSAGRTASETHDRFALAWLQAEYLTAVTNGLEVIRLIDVASVDPGELPIGRDHPPCEFSVGRPFDEFRRLVASGFEQLRRHLADSIGLAWTP